MNPTLILGIDAGGTKTTAAIASVGQNDAIKVLSRHTTGPGNPKRGEAEAAYKNVLDAIEFTAREAKVAAKDVCSAVVGMAGAGTETAQAKASEFLNQQLEIQRFSVVPDYKLALPAAFPDGGIAVIAGTGSIAHGVNGVRETRVGGHGYLIDDAGSGYWIGNQALQAVVRELDGRGPATSLKKTICDAHDAENAQALVAKLHTTASPLESIAAVAPLVIEASLNDQVARSILDEAAKQLSHMVSAACQNVGYKQDYSLALAGSVLTKTNAVRSVLEVSLREIGLEPSAVQPISDPVDGAIQLAWAAIHENA